MDRSEIVAVCACCLLVTVGAASTLAAGVSAVPTHDGGIENVSLGGPALVDTEDEPASGAAESKLRGDEPRVSLWESESFAANATVAPSPGVSEYRVCAYAHVNGTSSELGCERTTIAEDSAENVAVSNLTWPANASGTRNMSVELQPATEPNETLDNATLQVAVLARGGDADGDGLTNEEELKLDFDPLVGDMDEDGLTDGTEVNDYGTSPRNADTDGDGVRDGEEIEIGSNPIEADSDGDGLADDTELAVGTNPTSPRTTERLAVGAVALLYVGASTVVLRRRRRDDGDGDGSEAARSPSLSTAPEDVLNAAVTNGTGTDEAVQQAQSPALLTDEDRVRHLLDRHGGRMKQSMIVEETGWSKAKVSRLLSAMDDDDEIEKLSLGRENVISLDREWIDGPTASEDDPGTETPEPVADGAGETYPVENDP